MNLDVHIPSEDVILDADLSLPLDPRGVVIFAHGSGSSRTSHRNRYVAHQLCEAGYVTLLADLFTAEEDEDDTSTSLRFALPHLAGRIGDTIDWVHTTQGFVGLPVTLFGGATGATAAIQAASERPEQVAAVISRGGRPDLAGEALKALQAPTLLLAGADNQRVLDFNKEALQHITAPSELQIISDAGDLFQTPEALDAVCGHALRWIQTYATEPRG